MNVLIPLILISVAIATAFLVAFIWAVRSGQYEDTCTPSMRILGEDGAKRPPAGKIAKADQNETNSWQNRVG